MADQANWDLVHRETYSTRCVQCGYPTCLCCNGCNQPICCKNCDNVHLICPTEEFDDDGSEEN